VRSWLFPTRAAEATSAQVVASGASTGSYGRDPVDGDVGYRKAGSAGRQVPYWTAEKARTAAVAAYRINPMARAIVDTYTSFCVGDSGVSLLVSNPKVREVAEEFWTDPRNRLGDLQELWLRDLLLTGEGVTELMVGPQSGAVRFSPMDPSVVEEVTLHNGNPLWPDKLVIRDSTALVETGEPRRLAVVQVAEMDAEVDPGLRVGQAMFWTPWKALLTDRRGMTFLAPVLDWLDSYDTVLSNLIDRTALARYLVWDVTVQGGQDEVDEFIEGRGSRAVPPSGSVEVHSDSVTWEPKTAQAGAYEDVAANKAVLTNIASGSGLSKVWLAEPEDANRATSQSMAEPVRRRIGGLQKTWLAYQTELVAFAVDRAVAAKRLPAMVEATDPKTGQTYEIKAARSVQVTGPEVAAADAAITAQVLLNLSTGLEKLVQIGALSTEAAEVAARKGWEDFMGIPWTADLAKPDANPGDVATAVDDAKTKAAKAAKKGAPANLRPVPPAQEESA
jgi:hypothetical protein